MKKMTPISPEKQKTVVGGQSVSYRATTGRQSSRSTSSGSYNRGCSGANRCRR